MDKKNPEHKIDRDNRYGRPIEWVGAVGASIGAGYYAFRKLVRAKFHEDSKAREGTADLYRIRTEELANATDTRLGETLDAFSEKIGETPTLKALREARANYNATAAAANGAKFTPEMLEAKSLREQALGNFMATHADDLNKLKSEPRLIAATESYIKQVSAIKTRSDKLIDTFSADVLGFESRGLKGNTLGLVKKFRSFGPYSQNDILLPVLGALGAAAAVVTMGFNQFNTRAKLNANDKAVGEANERLDTLLKKSDAFAQGKPEEALQISPDLERARASKALKLQNERAKAHASADHAR